MLARGFVDGRAKPCHDGGGNPAVTGAPEWVQATSILYAPSPYYWPSIGARAAAVKDRKTHKTDLPPKPGEALTQIGTVIPICLGLGLPAQLLIVVPDGL